MFSRAYELGETSNQCCESIDPTKDWEGEGRGVNHGIVIRMIRSYLKLYHVFMHVKQHRNENNLQITTFN